MEFEKIRDIIVEIIGVDASKVTAETKLGDDLGADSLDLLQIVSEIEEEFGVEFTNEAAESVKSVDDVVKYVKKMAK